MSDKSCVLVLGMHRSGTSALCQVLVELGYRGPADAILPAKDNPYGYFESESVIVANDTVLALWDLDLYNPGIAAIDERLVARSFACRRWIRRATAAAVRGLDGDVVIKDPRISLFPGLWTRALSRFGFRVDPVLSLRHPDHVAESLLLRNNLPLELTYALWIVYNAKVILAEDTPDPAIVPYEHLTAGEWEKIPWHWFLNSSIDSTEIKRAVEARIDPGLNRSKSTVVPDELSGDTSVLRRWAVAFYDELCKARENEGGDLGCARKVARNVLDSVLRTRNKLVYHRKKSYMIKASRKRLKRRAPLLWLLKKLRRSEAASGDERPPLD